LGIRGEPRRIFRGKRRGYADSASRISLDTANVNDRTLIRDVCRITHHHDEAYLGALAVVVAIRSVLAGSWSKENNFLRIAAKSLPDSAVRDRIAGLLPLQHVPREVAARFGSSGWVIDTVPLALYSAQFIAELPLSKVIAQAIEAGGDTDTVASITGQIAGTVSGFEPDCAAHFSQVAGSKETTDVAARFADFLCANKTNQTWARVKLP
jgi:ADP-ribosylglycohydrolase